MSKKAKYKAVRSKDPYNCTVESARDIICQRCTYTGARKIARALNAMEAKPKAKPFAFDWSGIDPKYKWAALDPDWEWWAYTHKPQVSTDGTCFITQSGSETKVLHKPYPGDWRDSLQKRP